MISETRQTYSLLHIPVLKAIPNADAIIERIDLAARAATVYLRTNGMCLPDIPNVLPAIAEPPTLDRVDTHLRILVSEAVESFISTASDNPTTEVDGVAGNELFEVWVEASAPAAGHVTPPLHVKIAMWLC